MDFAVETSHTGVFMNSGQVCCAGTRTFVQEDIYDEFVKKSKERAIRRVVGDPCDPKTEGGPQVGTLFGRSGCPSSGDDEDRPFESVLFGGVLSVQLSQAVPTGTKLNFHIISFLVFLKKRPFKSGLIPQY